MAKDECYPEDIRDQFKTLVIDNMQPNNNLYEDVVVIYQKLTKNSDPEKFFSEFYGKIVLQSEKYVDVKNPQSTLITSKITQKNYCIILKSYSMVEKAHYRHLLKLSSTCHCQKGNFMDCNIFQVMPSQI